MKKQFLQELNELKFSFDPKQIIDYQTLLTLYYNIITSPEWENLKDDVYDNIDILINVYKLYENLDNINIDFNDLNSINLYKYYFVQLRDELKKNNKNNISVFFQNKLNDLLYQIEKSLTQSNKNSSIECIHNCLKCENPCSNNLSSSESSSENQILNAETSKITSNINKSKYLINTSTLENVQLNPNYIKEYFIYKNKIDYKCNKCGLSEWQNEFLQLLLNYKDHNVQNQSIDNIELLCPNCYSQIGYK